MGEAPLPAELATARKVAKYGVKAIFHRDELDPVEITGMEIADTLYRVFSDRKASPNIAEWTTAHPKEHDFLEAAREIWKASER